MLDQIVQSEDVPHGGIDEIGEKIDVQISDFFVLVGAVAMLLIKIHDKIVPLAHDLLGAVEIVDDLALQNIDHLKKRVTVHTYGVAI
jgi:hypothetical protein